MQLKISYFQSLLGIIYIEIYINYWIQPIDLLKIKNWSLAITFCFLQSLPSRSSACIRRYWSAYICFRCPSKTPWWDHRIRFCNRSNPCWNSPVSDRQYRLFVEWPAERNNRVKLEIYKYVHRIFKLLFFIIKAKNNNWTWIYRYENILNTIQ